MNTLCCVGAQSQLFIHQSALALSLNISLPTHQSHDLDLDLTIDYTLVQMTLPPIVET
jgi:hypothetical protein